MTPTKPATTELPSAGPLRRIAALVYDSLLIAALSLAYGYLAVAIEVWVLGGDPSSGEPVAGGPWFQAGWVTTVVLFYCIFWRRGGQTLGMRAWRLRLERDDNSTARPGWGQCLLRCLVAAPALAAGGIGYWWCYIDTRGRSLHDRLSATRVTVMPKAGG